jgi:fimbrial isopeptide formation D2 family protein/LPXTG-motif cell wall-anchored protein
VKKKGRISKLLSVVVSAAMALSCFSATAFADSSSTTNLTIKSKDNDRSYGIYQIFTGQYSNDKLADVVWGESVVKPASGESTNDGYDLSTTLIAALKNAKLPDTSDNPLATSFATLADNATAAAVAEKFAEANITDDSTNADALAAILADTLVKQTNPTVSYYKTIANSTDQIATTKEYQYTITGIPCGYYVIDENTSAATLNPSSDKSTDSKMRTYSKYVLCLAGDNGSVTEKTTDAPTLDKNIVTGTDTKSKYASASIGDSINFQLDGKVPDTSAYTKYFYVVKDTLSKGLEFTEDTLKLNITVGAKTLVKDTDYTYTITQPTTSDTNSYLEIVFKHFTEYTKDDAIKVTYSATLTDEAYIGNEGKNTNSVDLTYSNDPNAIYSGDPSNPDKPGSNDSDFVAKTPKSTVYVYTTGIELIKMNAQQNRLTGAKFTINGTTLNTVVKQYEQFTSVGKYNDYKTNNTPITEELYMKQTGNVYVVATELKDGTYSLKEITDASQFVSAGENDYELYKMTSDTEKIEKSGSTATEVTVSDQNGAVEINGLSAGTYTIAETQAPEGYSKLVDPISLTITWTAPGTGSTTCTWGFEYNGTTLVKPSVVDGTLLVKVENKEGSSLPTTGGIGTTIFYVVGTILVLGAGIALVTRRRMRKETRQI